MSDNREIKVSFAPSDYTGDYFERPDYSWAAPDQKQTPQQNPRTENIKGALASGFGFQIARTGITTITGRIGEYTGNYLQQNQVNNLFNGASLIGGLITGNPVVTVMTLFNTAVQMADFQAGLAKANQEAEGLSKLVGTSVYNRSRGNGGRV